MAVKRVLVFVFLCLAAPAAAGQTGGAFAVRALGVKVGDFSLTGSVSAGKYTASAQFVTTGLIGAVASVHFLLSATGTRSGSRFAPQHYAEQMDTGERRSRARLTYSGGVARSTGAQTGDRSTGAQTGGGPHAVSDAQQQGAVDPLTAMFVVLRDQPREGLCRTRQTIFDGERLSRIVLTTRSEAGGEVTCTGLFRRLAGFAPDVMRKHRQFALRVTYAPAGSVMRAMRMRAETIYGPATLVRR